jgi:hypothetical protein
MFRAYSYNDPEVKRVGDRVAAWMRSHPELWSEVFWQIALHYNHVHGTANPRRNYDNKQTPPCAGGNGDDDDMSDFVKAEQENLNAAGFTDARGRKLTVDGVIGPNTQAAMLKRDKAAAGSGEVPDHRHKGVVRSGPVLR